MTRFLLAIMVVLFCFAAPLAQAEDSEVLVTKVIDGDTVMLENGDIVRYIGIDAPPLKKNEGGPDFYAREAVRQNKSLVLLKKVRLEFDVEKKDSEGRILAYVYVKNLFVNGEMVRLGCARAVPHRPNLKYQDLLARSERDASTKYAGLWQEQKQESGPYYVGNKRTYVFHKPSCPLSNKVPEKSKIIFRTRADPISIGYIPCKKCKP
jgi:micrococcal nuclease